MKRRAIVALILAVCPLFGFAREWTDSTGKFKAEAEFVEFKDGTVQLRKPDGKVVTLPIEKLSQADQTFVKSQVGQPKAPDTATAEKQATHADSEHPHSITLTVPEGWGAHTGQQWFK